MRDTFKIKYDCGVKVTFFLPLKIFLISLSIHWNTLVIKILSEINLYNEAKYLNHEIKSKHKHIGNGAYI